MFFLLQRRGYFATSAAAFEAPWLDSAGYRCVFESPQTKTGETGLAPFEYGSISAAANARGGVLGVRMVSMKIRVATYNIHKGVSSIRAEPRVLALKQAIGLFNADVVFLQEVQGKHDLKAAKYGAEQLGQKHWPAAAQH